MKWLNLIFVVIVLLIGCAVPSGSPVKVYSEQGVMPIQAHRGGGLRIPENTLETFIETWEMGIIPEADIRTTQDDIIICMHDKTAKRLAPTTSDSLIDVPFEEMTLEVAQTLDVGISRGGQTQRIPTLESVFEAMSGHPERFIYLDYKKIDMDRLALMVRSYGLERQIIFTTKHHNLIMDWHSRIPESLSLLWIGGSQENIEKTFASIRENNYLGITTLQIHVMEVDAESDQPFKPSPKFLEERREEVSGQGILFQVLPWKMVEPEVYVQLMELGVRSFATDYPLMTVELYQNFMKK
ncbi:MAG: glycerophosphodiester phosphodiesterase family protein [Candidatus Marinimicrobia bacterium]|nr:glycerophosphodiester phosphodiesterase family protein [Candidatus Neomarinimicrobiota bacterium]MBT4947780.1 glycerophosphodiester phosphodiesterase family protein [Candidatus Neomarinimicrobiota bacterium]MBT5271267.1 glycerophosphodiester phosphodiesterase family protein [Candidatus Neomarinimicrobiota bacterium]